MDNKEKKEKHARRHRRVRAKIQGTPQRPRLSVFRSNRYVWAQLIDDVNGKTLAQATDWGEKTAKDHVIRMIRAERVGQEIGKHAHEKHISVCVFDRGGYKYHGRVKAVAEGARKAGLQC